MLDEAFQRFQILVDDVRPRWDRIVSEEDAKIQLIQRVLTDVLGWSLKSFSAERKHDSGFSDYIISDASSPAFVVEAKRIGRIPIKTAETEKFKPFKISGPALKDCLDAIAQSRNYASDEGIGVYVVTDGDVWIIGKTNVDGHKWREVEALVFPSMQSVLNDFSSFYDLLSIGQIRKRTYVRVFDEVHRGRLGFERELFSAIPATSITIAQKSSLAFDLDRVFDVYFSRMRGEDDPDLLVNCFVESRESRIADFSLEKMTAKILGNINPDFQNLDRNLSAVVSTAIEMEEGQTIFIIGPTGAGKTTFLDRFFRKTLPQKVREQCSLATINMLDSVGDEKAAVPWLIDKLIEQFEREMFETSYPKWDDLLGLYFGEYKRRSEGEGKELYETDPSKFKIQFGEFIEKRVRDDREGYLKRLLDDLVKNRKSLPVLVIDNIDELSFDLQKAVFQATQALKRHARHLLVLVPITDRSAWTFSKSDIFGIYASKSFFLPTPSPREVFRKRIEYLRSKAELAEKEVSLAQHFLSRGIRVTISDLNAFSKVLEEVFVENDYASKIIGEISNFNTRRMLSLSRRVMTSAVFDVDELMKGVISNGGLSPSPARFMNALLRGDYSFFRQGDTNEIYPIFLASKKIQFTPILSLRILALLESASVSGKSIDEKHMSYDSIFSYFDTLGTSEAATSLVLSSLLEARLIDVFDSSDPRGELGRSYSITFSGSSHLRLALSNNVFMEQMALTTLIDDSEAAAEIRVCYQSDGWLPDRLKKVRSRFSEYLLKADEAHIGEIPESPQYLSQIEIRNKLRRFLAGSEREQSEPIAEAVVLEGKVDWFDPEKGYGFIKVPGNPSGVYLKDKALFESGFSSISGGDAVRFSAVVAPKGLSVSKVLEIQSGQDSLTRSLVEVVRIFYDRGYGFAQIQGTDNDVFFHFSTVSTETMKTLRVGSVLLADVYHDEEDGSYEVRTVIGSPEGLAD